MVWNRGCCWERFPWRLLWEVPVRFSLFYDLEMWLKLLWSCRFTLEQLQVWIRGWCFRQPALCCCSPWLLTVVKLIFSLLDVSGMFPLSGLTRRLNYCDLTLFVLSEIHSSHLCLCGEQTGVKFPSALIISPVCASTLAHTVADLHLFTFTTGALELLSVCRRRLLLG